MRAGSGASLRTAAGSAAAAGLATLLYAAPALLPFLPGRSARLAAQGDPGRVALTFDDGPNPASTPHFIEVLARYRVCTTFFLLGCMAARCPELCRSLVAAGHEVTIRGLRVGPLREHALPVRS